MSQISAREDSERHAARDHWIAERIFDWSGVPTVHLRPTFFSQWLLYPFARKTIVEQSIIDLPYGTGRHAPIGRRSGTSDRRDLGGLPEFLIQHFCAIAVDYQNGIFSGADKIIAEVTGAPSMTVQDFVASHRAAFDSLDAAA
jgi:NAD(P)H dehydrogenase (quinone)